MLPSYHVTGHLFQYTGIWHLYPEKDWLDSMVPCKCCGNPARSCGWQENLTPGNHREIVEDVVEHRQPKHSPPRSPRLPPPRHVFSNAASVFRQKREIDWSSNIYLMRKDAWLIINVNALSCQLKFLLL